MLRAEMKEARKETHAAIGEAAAKKLAANFPLKLLDRFGPEVSCYWPIGSEMDTRPLMQKLSAAGAKLSLPVTQSDGGMVFKRYEIGDGLVSAEFGLSEPNAKAEEVTPTLILMPLLAYDPKGQRLGYGKGHYDKTLAKLRENGRAFACGLCFSDQFIEEVPAEAHDIALDWVVTEKGSTPLFLLVAREAVSSQLN